MLVTIALFGMLGMTLLVYATTADMKPVRVEIRRRR